MLSGACWAIRRLQLHWRHHKIQWETWEVFVDIQLPQDECWIIHTWPSRHCWEFPKVAELTEALDILEKLSSYKSLQILKSNMLQGRRNVQQYKRCIYCVQSVFIVHSILLHSAILCRSVQQEKNSSTSLLSVERFAPTFWGIFSRFPMSWKKQEIQTGRSEKLWEKLKEVAAISSWNAF